MTVVPIVSNNFSTEISPFKASASGVFSLSNGSIQTRINSEAFLLSDFDPGQVVGQDKREVAALRDGVDFVGAFNTSCPDATCEVGIVFSSGKLPACPSPQSCRPAEWLELFIAPNQNVKLILAREESTGSLTRNVLQEFKPTTIINASKVNFRLARNERGLRFLTDVGDDICFELPVGFDSISQFQVGIRWRSWDDDPNRNVIHIDNLVAAAAPLFHGVGFCRIPLPELFGSP